jgi:hypothetical protein
LAEALQEVCNGHGAGLVGSDTESGGEVSGALQLVRYIGENGFIGSITLTAGNFSGTTMPSVSAVESDLVREIRDLYPVAKIECIDRDELFGNGPSEYRRRAYFRVRLKDGDGRGMTP